MEVASGASIYFLKKMESKLLKQTSKRLRSECLINQPSEKARLELTNLTSLTSTSMTIIAYNTCGWLSPTWKVMISRK